MAKVYADEPHIGCVARWLDRRRINHSEAYSQDGANTNWVESFFSRLRRMIERAAPSGERKVSRQYAKRSGLERGSPPLSNGTAAHRTLGLALHHPVSREWAGYWQRAA